MVSWIKVGLLDTRVPGYGLPGYGLPGYGVPGYGVPRSVENTGCGVLGLENTECT